MSIVAQPAIALFASPVSDCRVAASVLGVAVTVVANGDSAVVSARIGRGAAFVAEGDGGVAAAAGGGGRAPIPDNDGAVLHHATGFGCAAFADCDGDGNSVPRPLLAAVADPLLTTVCPPTETLCSVSDCRALNLLARRALPSESPGRCRSPMRRPTPRPGPKCLALRLVVKPRRHPWLRSSPRCGGRELAQKN